MTKKIPIGLALAVAVAFVVVATRPATYHVERSTTIEAPAMLAFMMVAHLSIWPEWSPWEARDPRMKRTFSLEQGSMGSSATWDGPHVGKGGIPMIDRDPPSRVGFRVELMDPVATIVDVTFDIRQEGPESSTVTWSLAGKNDFMGKVKCLVTDRLG